MKSVAISLVIAACTLGGARARAQDAVGEQAPSVTPPESTEPTQPAPSGDLGAQAPLVEPALAPEPSAEPSADLMMSADELAALGLSSTEPTVDTSLQISGFADFGLGGMIGPKDSGWRATMIVPRKSTFYVGNFNLYVSKNISKSVRMMSEARLTFLPNGSAPIGGDQDRGNTTAYDYTDFGRPTRWGGIILQRVHLDWEIHSLLSVRGGLFLTPYGVWNVDHGSPVFIPVRRPWSIGVGWIPERQTGVELFGRAVLSSDHTLGYHLTVSNGVGPISEYQDLDENKAIGGRLYWEYYGVGRLRLGVSAYYGRDTNSISNIIPGAELTSKETIKSQYDALTFAGDLTWNLRGLHIQTEWLSNQRAFTEKGRARVQQITGAIIPSDVSSWGGYGLIGYRFDWLGVMPYFLSERVVGDVQYNKLKLYTLQVGLNVRPIDSVVLKASYERVEFKQASFQPLNVIMSQIAWAF